MIDAKDLSKTFVGVPGQPKRRVVAVESVSFSAKDGCITGLLGPNGAGKSTTLRMLATLVRPDTGTALIDGHSITDDVLAVRQHLGFMPHNAGIYPRLTTRENIRYSARLCGMDKVSTNSRMATRGLRSIIRQLANDGHCIVFSSHIMQEVAALCDEIAIISDGNISMTGSLDALLENTGQTNLEDAFVAAIGETL